MTELVKDMFDSSDRIFGDITYLRTSEGWLYLATVIDLHTRMVTGWAMTDHIRASVVTGALAMARDRGHRPRMRFPRHNLN